MRIKAASIAILISCVFLGGCITLKDPEASLEYTADVVGKFDAGQTVGQTLVSRRPRMDSVQLWLRQSSPPSSPDDLLTFELYYTPEDVQALVTVPITYGAMTHFFPLTISFPARNDPPNQKYYLLLKTRSGSVDVLGRSEDVYPGGWLFLDGIPQPSDAAFRLSYDYDMNDMLMDAGVVLSRIWLIIPLLILLWLPGRLIVSFVGCQVGEERHSLDWGQRTALSIGLSLAIVPVVMLWTGTLGLRWNRTAIWTVAILLLVIALWRLICRIRHKGFSLSMDGGSLFLFGVFLFSLGIRLVMVRDLAAPAWVDPVHHATIVRAILDQGGFPHDYAPYVQANTAGYHPGFHSIVATFHWLSDMGIAPAMLLLGQVLNALSILAVYLFTTTLTKDRLAGLIAALITGVFSPMPAYYASWGRYTQLTGLLILPACLAIFVYFIEDASADKSLLKHPTWVKWSIILIGGIACGGLAITHYRVIIFLGTLLLAYLFAQILRSLNKQPLWRTFPLIIVPVGAIIIGAFLFTLPWWPEFYQTAIAPRLELVQSAPQPLKIDWGYLTPAYGKSVMIIAGLGLAWSIVRARWFGLTLALWVGFLFMSANRGTVSLPGAGFVNMTSVEIMLFMPLSVLAGYLVSCLVQAGKRILPHQFIKSYQFTLIGIAFVLALFGARKLLPILNPITFLIREADKPALSWIQENIPSSETILINPFLWNNGVYAGQDGGYWITPITGRKSLPPPVLYDLGETLEINRINRISHQVIDHGKDPVVLHDLMRSQKLRYVYIGARGGVLSPEAIRESPLFRTIYHQDGVWIFELL